MKQKDSKGEYENKSPKVKARLLFNFANKITMGDGVFVRHGLMTLLGFGIVQPPPEQTRNSKPAGAYFFDKDHPHFQHALKVGWLNKSSSPIKSFQLAQDFIVLMRDGVRLDTLKKTMGLVSDSSYHKNNTAENILKKKAEAAEALEGRIQVKEARFRLRNHRLIELKKAGSDYSCEVCGFSFARVYGKRGRKFIIVHHIEPLGSRHRPSMTGLEDLALICSNCHAMLHTGNPPISPSELRSLATVQKFRDELFE